MVLQRVMFSKRYTLSLASFQLEHPLRMQASSVGITWDLLFILTTVEQRRLNTSLLRIRKVLGWIGTTDGTCISVTECIVTQAHDAHIYVKVETFETYFVARQVNYKKKKNNMPIWGNETGSQKLSGPQREDLSSGFPTMQGSNQPTQLQRLVQ